MSPLFSQIEDFGVAKTEKDIGFYAGFIGENTFPQSLVKLCIDSRHLCNGLFSISKDAHSCLAEH